MTKKDYVPANDLELIEWGGNAYLYAQGNSERWGVIPPNSEILSRFEDYKAAVERCRMPTRSKVDTLVKNDLKTAVVKDLRSYIQGYVARNPLVTNQDREMMGLSIRDTIPTAVEAPTVRAMGKVVYKGAGLIELLVMPEGDISESARAYYGNKIVYEVMDMEAAAPQSIRDLNESRFTRRKKEKFVFQPEDSGKRIYFSIRYENSKGDAGPWCPIFSAVIP